MPTYNFRNKVTNEEFSEFMKISELDKFLLEHPDVEQLVSGAPMIAYNMLTRKPDSGFRDVLKRIKRASGRDNKIDTW